MVEYSDIKLGVYGVGEWALLSLKLGCRYSLHIRIDIDCLFFLGTSVITEHYWSGDRIFNSYDIEYGGL